MGQHHILTRGSHCHDQRHDWNHGLYRGLIAVLVSAHIKPWCQSLEILKDTMKLIVSPAVYIPFGSNRSSNRGDHEGHLDHNHILSQHIRTYMCVPHHPKSGTSIMFDDHIRSTPHCGPDRDNPVQTYLIVSEGETRSWQIVSSEIEQSRSYRIQVQQSVSERIDPHHWSTT